MSRFASFVRSPAVIGVCRILIGLVLLAAALGKIGDMGTFAAQIHNYRLFPLAAENLLAITVPWIELLTGLALVFGAYARSGAFLAAAMMVVFTLAVAQAVARGLDFECGCFGTADAARVGVKKLLENVGLTAVAIVAAFKAR